MRPPPETWHSPAPGASQHHCRPTTMPTLICDCNKTMPLDPKVLGKALGEGLTLHSTLCRREAGAFQQAVKTGEEVVVACTQEKRLFGELGHRPEASGGG